MSTIDTGLGWTCDSSFYVDDTTTALGVNRLNETYRKVNAGAAICAKVKRVPYANIIYTVSTVADNVVMTPSYNGTYISVIDGVTWYMGVPEYGSADATDYSDFPWANENNPFADVEDKNVILRAILTAANVNVSATADKIPTTDYVKTFVEGVEAETATRVKANAANIGSLSSLTTAAKTDLVSAINELESTKQSKTTSGILTTRCKPSYANFFEPVTWNGLTSFDGNYIWSDDENIYYSNGETQYVLNKSTSTWTTKTWNGLTNFSGEHIWTDGENIYYSYESTQYVLDKSTSTWTTKTWNGIPLSIFYGEHVWTDGETIYYSYINHKYVLNKSTSTWTTKTWGGSIDFYGNSIWTDGRNIYCLDTSGDSRVLEKSTSTWLRKTWNGLTSLSDNRKNNIWTDGENIYYSKSNIQYVLNGSTWEAVFSFPFDISGQSIWSDGENIYYSNGETQYVLKKRNVSAARK